MVEKPPVEIAVVKEEVKAPEPPKAVEPPAIPVEKMVAKPVEQAPVKIVQEPVTKPVETTKMEMAATTPEEPKEIVKEIVTGSSVIIRKGDSLWLVSRRKYGAGIRYTTIFEANREQIRDPNLIFPGQVLEIPHSEEAN